MVTSLVMLHSVSCSEPTPAEADGDFADVAVEVDDGGHQDVGDNELEDATGKDSGDVDGAGDLEVGPDAADDSIDVDVTEDSSDGDLGDMYGLDVLPDGCDGSPKEFCPCDPKKTSMCCIQFAEGLECIDFGDNPVWTMFYDCGCMDDEDFCGPDPIIYEHCSLIR